MLSIVRSKDRRYSPYSTLTHRAYTLSSLSHPLSEPLYFITRLPEVPRNRALTPAPIIDFADDGSDYEGIKFNNDQEDALFFLDSRMKCDVAFYAFIRGAAGCGKSIVLCEFVRRARQYFQNKEACEVTAATGMAAMNVDGVTIHSLLMFYPGQAPFAKLDDGMLEKLRAKLKQLRILIIDEIGLVSALFLAQIDHRLRQILNSDLPFGGVSVVAFGDLLQLPPMPNLDESGANKFSWPGYIFWPIPTKMSALRDTVTPNSPPTLWKTLFESRELGINVRTSNAVEAGVLADIRLGNDSFQIREFLKECCKMEGGSVPDVVKELETLEATHRGKTFIILARTHKEVDEVNEWKYHHSVDSVRLPHMPVVRRESGREFPRWVKKTDPKDLCLVVGSKLMITHNMKALNLANGLMGRLLEVTPYEIVFERLTGSMEPVRLTRKLFTNGSSYWRQFPVAMAEAVTVHKSQGMTFDGVVVLTRSMDPSWYGGFYTVISRARSLRLSRVTNMASLVWPVCEYSKGEMEDIAVRSRRLKIEWMKKKVASELAKTIERRMLDFRRSGN